MGMVYNMVANLNKFIEHWYWSIIALPNTCAFPLNPMSHAGCARVHSTCTSSALNPIWIVVRPKKNMFGIRNYSAEVILRYFYFRHMFWSLGERTQYGNMPFFVYAELDDNGRDKVYLRLRGPPH